MTQQISRWCGFNDFLKKFYPQEIGGNDEKNDLRRFFWKGLNQLGQLLGGSSHLVSG